VSRQHIREEVRRMNNPRKILSIKDIELLESKNIDIPDKELSDSEWDNLIVQIAINLEQEEAERLIDILDDSTK
jgi:hypothetical protein